MKQLQISPKEPQISFDEPFSQEKLHISPKELHISFYGKFGALLLGSSNDQKELQISPKELYISFYERNDPSEQAHIQSKEPHILCPVCET